MLLSDAGITAAVGRGALSITPWCPGLIGPASYDVTLGGEFLVQHRPSAAAVLDPGDPDASLYRPLRVAADRYLDLTPGMFVLGATVERLVLGDRVAVRVEGKSTLGRCGLAVHATAGWVDPGFAGHVTLELSNVGTVPVRLRPGMRIGQLCVFELAQPCARPYNGQRHHYQNQAGPTAPRG